MGPPPQPPQPPQPQSQNIYAQANNVAQEQDERYELIEKILGKGKITMIDLKVAI